MTRGANRGEESSKKANIDVQKLSDRMEEMAAKFGADIAGFKKELQEKAAKKSESSSDSSTKTSNESLARLAERFSTFETSIVATIERIKKDMEVVKSKISTAQPGSTNENVILVHGLNENLNGDLYTNIVELMSDKVGFKIDKTDLNHCFRLGANNPSAKKPRPILVAFCRRWMRDEIFANKKRLKGTGVLFTELLTRDNLKLFKLAKDRFKNLCWTVRGKVVVLNEGVKVTIDSIDKLNQLTVNVLSDSESSSN